MSEVPRELIEEYATRLDGLWQEARSVVSASWTQFDESFNRGRARQRSIVLEYANKMDIIVEEMLQLPLYMGYKKQAKDYARLEAVLIQNIIRICRMDADTGIKLKKSFFEHIRSSPADVRMYWKMCWNRVLFWLDDGVRAPS